MNVFANDDEADPQVATANAQQRAAALAEAFTGPLAMREEGLGEEFARTPGSAIKQLRQLHHVLDEIGDVVAPFVACRSGCSACCHYPVQVYPIEAELIAKRTGARRKAQVEPAQNFNGVPCPFLVSGQCSIYDIRPLACRRHFALTRTAYWCAPERANAYALPILRFTGVDSAVEAVVRKDGRGEPVDIRQVFDYFVTKEAVP